MIDCRRSKEHLPEYVLGHLDERYSDELERHLGDCEGCRDVLSDTRQLWALLPLQLEPVGPPSDVESRMLARIRGLDATEHEARRHLKQEGALKAHRSPDRRWRRILPYVVAAGVLIGMSVVTTVLVKHQSVHWAGSDAFIEGRVRSLADQLGRLDEMEQAFASPALRFVSFRDARRPAHRVRGYVVWDLAANQWHFFAFDMQPAPAGKTHQMWLVGTNGRVYAADTFDIDEQGLGSVVADLVPGDAVVKAMVTIEPIGGSQQPSELVCLEAAVSPR